MRFWTTRPLQMLFPSVVWRTDSSGVHLTFDDGPDPVSTPRVLEFLSKHSLKATFFLVGQNVNRYPDIPRQIMLEGHGLGLHSYEHTRLAFRGRSMIQDQLGRSKAAIQQATGHDVRLFRPPYGFFEPSLLKHVGQMGFVTVMWDVDPGDSLESDPQVVVKRISSGVRPGSIILLHDNLYTRERVDAVLLGVLNTLNDRSLKVAPLNV